MTANQIAYTKAQEEQRANRAREAETIRANDLNWQLGIRSQETQKSIAQLNAATTLSKTNIETATERYKAELGAQTSKYVADRNAETQLQVASINADTSRYVADTNRQTQLNVAAINAETARYSADTAAAASRYKTDTDWAVQTQRNHEVARHNMVGEKQEGVKTGSNLLNSIGSFVGTVARTALAFMA